MKSSTFLVMALMVMTQWSYAVNFTSTTSGHWDNGATWGNNNPGIAGIDYPGQNDNVTILSGHIILVNNVNDNDGPAVSPEGLGLPNVGDGIVNGNQSFPSAEATMFYHRGKIYVQDGGTLHVTPRVIIGDSLVLEGTFRTNNDVVNIGYLSASSNSILDIGDDFIISGNSVTDIDGFISTGDDLYIDHLDAILGGSGSLTIADDVQTFNNRNHSPRAQICSNFIVGCGDDCDPSVSGSQGLVEGTSTASICSDLLPIELAYIQAFSDDKIHIKVKWATVAEINNAYFEVEHSTNQQDWNILARIEGAGHSTGFISYHTIHEYAPQGQHYYRIKQVDFDASYSYSDIVAVTLNAKEVTTIKISPNPVPINNTIQLVANQDIDQVEVYDLQGRAIPVINTIKNNVFSTKFEQLGTYIIRIKIQDAVLIRKIQVF